MDDEIDGTESHVITIGQERNICRLAVNEHWMEGSQFADLYAIGLASEETQHRRHFRARQTQVAPRYAAYQETVSGEVVGRGAGCPQVRFKAHDWQYSSNGRRILRPWRRKGFLCHTGNSRSLGNPIQRHHSTAGRLDTICGIFERAVVATRRPLACLLS